MWADLIEKMKERGKEEGKEDSEVTFPFLYFSFSQTTRICPCREEMSNSMIDASPGNQSRCFLSIFFCNIHSAIQSTCTFFYNFLF